MKDPKFRGYSPPREAKTIAVCQICNDDVKAPDDAHCDMCGCTVHCWCLAACEFCGAVACERCHLWDRLNWAWFCDTGGPEYRNKSLRERLDASACHKQYELSGDALWE